MRIAIVTDYYYPMLGGITEHVHGQARELARRGHEVTVVTGHLLHTPAIADPDARPVVNEGFEVVRLGVGVPLYGNASQTIHTVPAGLVLQLRRLFKRLGVDVVHLHAPYNPSMCAIAPLAIPGGAIGVATYHSVFAPGVLLDVFAPILRRWLGRLDAHVVVSEACIGSLAPYFPFDYRIIPNGIDDRHFSPDAEPLPELREGGKPLILFLGRFDPRNGLPTMLEAFERVHAEHEGSVRLCVVGDGPLGNVYRRKLSERVAADVIWAGRVDWSRPRYYASADIHCTPCQRASFGMVLLEAMSTGRPVVASRISGFQLLMEHGRQGLMVSPADDANRFAQALLYLLDRPAERARMGREGRITAVTRYAWSSVAEQLERLYDELLARKRGSP
jgi:phosphatidylinositol alpha-mannosyltransferase